LADRRQVKGLPVIESQPGSAMWVFTSRYADAVLPAAANAVANAP
jgi:hypothetical protein